MGVQRLQVIARHINGEGTPLWVDLMDAGHDQIQKPLSRLGCRCTSEKWRYVCTCYPCLRWAGREEDFEWTPAALAAQPAVTAVPVQWKSKKYALAPEPTDSKEDEEKRLGAKELPRSTRPLPPRQSELVAQAAGPVRRFVADAADAVWGPIAVSDGPRFAGIATFARLPQLEELRQLQRPREGLLHVRVARVPHERSRAPRAASGASDAACATSATSKVNKVSGVRSESASQLLSLRVGKSRYELIEEIAVVLSLEDSLLEVEDVSSQKSWSMALWTLPSCWHRQSFDGFEIDFLLEKRFGPVDVSLLGVPFDSGCSYRPGARFGPEAIRSNSRLTRPYLIEQQQRPLQERQVVDTGDVFATPFNIEKAVQQIYEACKQRLDFSKRLLVFGGDHTLSYPSIKAVAEKFGPVVLVHFDSHLDTFPSLWGQDVWHGAPFRNCWEEGLLAKDGSTHIGIRATTYSAEDFHESEQMGIATVTAEDVHQNGVETCVDVVRRRWALSGGAPVYLSVDIDVLDPSVAPGTGTPEVGGLLAHQLLQFIRGLSGLPIVAADVVEVAPAYDHAGITSMAAANIMLEQIALINRCMDVDGFTPSLRKEGRSRDDGFE